MQAFQHLGGITSEQPVRMLPVDLQHFIKTPGGNECVGVLYDRRHVVVDVSQLRRQIAGFRHSSTLDIGLQEGAEPIRVGVEIGYFSRFLIAPATSPASSALRPRSSNA